MQFDIELHLEKPAASLKSVLSVENFAKMDVTLSKIQLKVGIKRKELLNFNNCDKKLLHRYCEFNLSNFNNAKLFISESVNLKHIYFLLKS